MVILVNDMSPPDGDLARPVPRIIEQSPDAPLRGPYEQLIRSKYAQVHGARLEQYLDLPIEGAIARAAKQPTPVIGKKSRPCVPRSAMRGSRPKRG
jgi:hypothetical protein